MKTLLFCTSYIPDQQAWQQRYVRWLEHQRAASLAADAIVLIDDHSPFQPPALALLPAERIGLDALADQSMLRFAERLGQPGALDAPGWYRGMFASVCLALHYGFERIIHVESNSFIVSERLAEYLTSRTTGWTTLWRHQSDCPESAIQVLCKDAFHLLDTLVAEGPFAFRGKPAELVLPFTTVEKSFIGERYHERKQAAPHKADYAVHDHLAGLEPDMAGISKNPAWPMRPMRPVQPLQSLKPVLPTHASAGQLESATSQQQLHDLSLIFCYDAEVACRYGIAAYQDGNFTAARGALERSDWLRPEHPTTCKFLGATRMQQGELPGALSAARQSARLNPADADAQNMAGAFNFQAGRPLEAIAYMRAALALDPEASAALSNLALIKWHEPSVAERFPAGMRGIELEVRGALLERLRTNRLTARGAAALLAYGVHFKQGFDELVQLARVVITEPESDAQTLFAAGNALIVSGDHRTALSAYQRAALLAPQSDRIKSAVGYASICQGGVQFQEGFTIANQCWPNINPAAFIAHPKQWSGEHDAQGKLLIYQEQGIGDALICLRLVPLVMQRTMAATLWLRPELAALVSHQAGVPLLKSSERPDAGQAGFDRVSTLFGLIDALHITAGQIPAPLLIEAPSAKVKHFASRLKALQRLRVGLCLFGNPGRSDDWARSVNVADMALLTEVQDVDWINLSIDARPERQSLRQALPDLTDLAAEMLDFEASAALISNLDVVISIDSVVAHLAAALGKPVLLLCPSIADWRWRIGETDSPWWPTVEVFRADRPGKFTSAVAAICSRIEALASQRSGNVTSL